MTTYTYQHDGKTYTVTLEAQPDGSTQASVNGVRYPVVAVPLREGGWQLSIGGQRLTAYTAQQGSARYVNLSGTSYTLALADARSTRRRTSSGGGDLTAQMPGQVVSVLVAEGDVVTRGQALVVLEAMKMEIRASAPADGRVKRLLVKVGDIVERGQPLLEIEMQSP
jgi:biotin carboxyl carrier protein